MSKPIGAVQAPVEHRNREHVPKGYVHGKRDREHSIVCSCGWWSAIHRNEGECRKEWRKHVAAQET